MLRSMVRLPMPTEAHRLIREIAVPDGIHSLLASVLRDGSYLAEVAAASYMHNNGFNKIVLATGAGGEYKLRLHLWRPHREPHSEHIHNHRWMFSSIVLAGEMQMEFFELASDHSGGPQLERHRYSRSLGSSRFGTQFVDRVKIRSTFAGTLGSGASYWLRGNVFHRITVPREDLAATLVLQTAALGPDCEVLTNDPLGKESVVELKPFTVAELAEQIDSLLRSSSL